MKILFANPIKSLSSVKKTSLKNEYKAKAHSQNFGRLILDGLILNGHIVDVVTNAPECNNIIACGFKEVDNRVTYHYNFLINIPLLRQLFIFISSFFISLQWGLNNRRESVILCNSIQIPFALASLFVAKIFRIKSIGVVADYYPVMVSMYKGKKSMLNKINHSLRSKLYCDYINSFDYYVLLTEQMNEVVNLKKKPYIVIEGLVDVNCKNNSSYKNVKDNKRNIIYAGGILEEYGVKKLIDSFRLVKGENLRLSIYGSGKMEKVMESFEKKDPRIHYYGVVSHEIIFKEEQNATLLINPRPTNSEFAKYSFPSKNMEYMVSGTPVLTTRLSGMPKEYEDYVFLFEDESIEGYAATLQKILDLSDEFLNEKGISARNFVLKFKNNIIQTKKIIDIIQAENN